ncbi:MAG: hypothetical protein JJU21_13065 [Salinarimonas sp.]|nr:hypothetical protein [Salinarimonas sp.]
MSDKSKKSDLQKNMEKALAMKQAAGDTAQIPDDQTAGKGMASNPNEKIAPSGALNAEGHKPALSRARGVRVSDKG